MWIEEKFMWIEKGCEIFIFSEFIKSAVVKCMQKSTRRCKRCEKEEIGQWDIKIVRTRYIKKGEADKKELQIMKMMIKEWDLWLKWDAKWDKIIFED